MADPTGSISSSSSSSSMSGDEVSLKYVQEDPKNDSGSGMVLKRTIGLSGAVGIVVGTIIGSGIFISPKGVAEAAGSEGLALTIWGIGGIISTFGALGLAELSSLIRKSGGEYQFIRFTYAEWLGYLQGWTMGLLIKPSSQAVVATTCARYILVPVYNDGCGEPPVFIVNLLAAVVILLLTALNVYSVSWASKLVQTFTVGKVLALGIIIAGGIYMLAIGETDNLKTGFQGSNKEPGQIMMGFYSAMFAYNGWENLIYVTEEIKNPKRNIPLTFVIAMPLVMGLYMMANISYFTVMSIDELLDSPAVAITWAQAVIPQVYWLIPACVAISTFGTVTGTILVVGRLLFVMSREKEMPEVLQYIHYKRRTPMPAIVFNVMFALIYVLASSVVSLIDFLGFIQWFFIGFTQLSVVILRFKMKDAPRSYKVPIVLPIIVFIFAAALVIIPVVDAPQIEFLFATLIMLAGLIFYIPIVVFDKRAGCMRYITKFFQLLMEVVPTEGIAEEDAKKDD